MPRSRQARMIRTAISPRFAISTRSNGGSSLRKDELASERDVAMLLRRIRLALARQHLEGADEAGPRLGRPDHVVDVPATRRDPGIGELGLVVLDESAPLHL